MTELEAQTDLPVVAEAQTETAQLIENGAQTNSPCVAEAQTQSIPSIAAESQTEKVIKKDKHNTKSSRGMLTL